MKSPARLLLPALATLVLSACSLFKPAEPDETPDKKKPNAPQLVGRIASIPADRRFVLIESYGRWNIQTGAILTTRGPEERTANLLVTGESLGQFAAADLQSGLVEVGDAVYSHHTPKPVETTPDTENPPNLPENPQNTDSENVQKNN